MNRRLPPAVVQEQVTVQVKWFNPTKGFGFVKAGEGDGSDAFLHASVLPVENASGLAEGTTLVCDLAEGQKGLMVAAVFSVDESTAQPSAPRPRPTRPEPTGPAESGEGTVKFFNAAKGFGFVVPDNGGQDVFVSARTLSQTGLASLESDQRVRYTARQGDRGPMADSVELI